MIVPSVVFFSPNATLLEEVVGRNVLKPEKSET